MALALLFENNDTMYLDVVTNYSKSKSSSISNHPIDRSSVITDHVSKSNPNISVRAIVSAADFHNTGTRPSELLDGTEDTPPLDSEYNIPVEGITITSPSRLLDFLPDSIQNIFGQSQTSSVTSDPFRGYSHQVARDRLNDAWENSELITILDYDYDVQNGKSVSVRSFENCLITRFEDTEDVGTGDSLTANLTFQKVRFAYLKEVDVQIAQQTPSSEVSDQAAGEDDFGDQTNNAELQTATRVGEQFDQLLFQGGFEGATQSSEEIEAGF